MIPMAFTTTDKDTSLPVISYRETMLDLNEEIANLTQYKDKVRPNQKSNKITREKSRGPQNEADPTSTNMQSTEMSSRRQLLNMSNQELTTMS